MAGSLNYLGMAPEYFRVFVETGTYLGLTTQLAAAMFKKVYTIELSTEIFQSTREKLKHLTNVEFINGDSSVELIRLAGLIAEPAVFFLDAHFAGGRTARGSKEVPLYEELAAIVKRPYLDLIIMDDFRLFGKTGQCGTPGDAIYPPMHFDWTDITLENCVKIFQASGKRCEAMAFDDRVYVLQFGAIRQLKSISDLRIGQPQPPF